jgi:iron(III) transport system ATP-binding protein
MEIVCEHLTKKYGDVIAIPDFSLAVKSGELLTLLGPSGCGKTSLLRMIAGFIAVDSGIIRFNGNIINDVPPENRNIGFVFQNFALFPHLTVWKNVAFGLGNRKVPKDEIKRRVDAILREVKIDALARRLPGELSGGEQQRAALARAIVIKPDVLLMDEPLSNLDAMLRVELRAAIREIQKAFCITTLYVTHDQEEALAVSDRIAVLKGGILQQLGTPDEIFRQPANEFVAAFTNFLPASISLG